MDKYSLNARIYPVVFLLLPLVIVGISYSIEFEKYIHILSSLGLTSVLLYFMSNVGRDAGYIKENTLWESWGGMPTAQLLSFQNDQIDKYTKRKYHSRLQTLAPINGINIDFETADFNDVVEVYKSWTKYLISQTRDTKKFSLQFKENVSYGFRRNLWGLKPIGILFCLIIFFSNFIIQYYLNQDLCFWKYPLSFLVSEFLLVILLIIWISIIKSDWVKIPAFAFGLRLLEAIEHL
jgi:hypothetical protein